VRKLRWLVHAALPCRASHASDTGFFQRHFPAADAAAAQPTAGFHAWSFSQSANGKKTLPAWVMALLWVLAYSSYGSK